MDRRTRTYNCKKIYKLSLFYQLFYNNIYQSINVTHSKIAYLYYLHHYFHELIDYFLFVKEIFHHYS